MTRQGSFIQTTGLAAALILATTQSARDLPEPGMPVNVIVTATPHKGETLPQLTIDDVLVSQNHEHLPVTALAPLRSQDGIQLWILIDDATRGSLGTQFKDLKQFIGAQPATTQIGIGYMRNGSVQTVQPLTADHQAAAKALRLPIGMPGISASPYLTLTSLIRAWPAGTAAREVIMVTSGMDPVFGNGPENPYLRQAIDTADRAGVVVYSIYYNGAGRYGRSYRGRFWGQTYLSQLTEETGGELYWLGYGNPVTITPYLDDISRRMNSQYLLTFLARPGNKPEYQSVKISTEHPHVKLEGPDKVYVPTTR